MNQTIKTELGEIEYSSYGSGKPVLFLHGGHGNSKDTLFTKGYDTTKFELITPSRPGYGETPLGNFEQPKEAAELVVALLDRLKISKIIIIGISAGGPTAIQLASKYPERTEKLVLISAVTKKWMDETDDLYRRGKKMFSPEREKMSWKFFRIFFGLLPKMMTKVLFKELSTSDKHNISKDEILEIKEMSFKQSSGNGFVSDLEQEIETGVIEKIKCPTLILHSKNDKSVKLEMATYASEKIPNSTLKTYNNKWGHLLWIGEESSEPIKDLINFLNN